MQSALTLKRRLAAFAQGVVTVQLAGVTPFKFPAAASIDKNTTAHTLLALFRQH
jgi:hypothetical protein